MLIIEVQTTPHPNLPPSIHHQGSGADSFVGANLVFALLWSEHKVRGKVRMGVIKNTFIKPNNVADY